MEKAKENPAGQKSGNSVIRKITRFLWRTVKYSFLTVVLLLLAFVIAIQFPGFQTWLGKKVSSYYSKELKTKVSIDKVTLNFFHEVQLNGVYVEDLHKDTLLYGGNLDVKILDFSIKKKYLALNTIALKNINAKVIKYRGEDHLNFQFLADYFGANDTTRKDSSAFKIAYGRLLLDNVNFAYVDRNDTTVAEGMNYADIKLTGVHGAFSDIHIKNEVILVNVEGLSATEKSGFGLKRFDAIVKVSSTEIRADSLLLLTNNTYLHGNLSFKQDSYKDFSDFVNKVNMNLDLRDSSKIGAADIAIFVPGINGMNESILLSGKIRGTVNDLSGSKLILKYGEHTEFLGDFSLVDVTEPEQFYLHFNIKKLTTSKSDLETIPLPPYNEKHKLSLPANLGTLGIINYSGKIDGFLSDIAAKGNLKTAIGKISTDLGISNIGNKDLLLAYHGKIKAENFNIGKFLDIPGLETITLNVKTEGRGTKLKDLWAKIDGEVSQIRYNNYNYAQLTLGGEFKNKKFEGKFDLHDPHADLDFNGSVDFTDKVPDMDFITTINHFEMQKLGLIKGNDSINDLSSQVAIMIKGNNANDMTGRINFDNTIYHVNNKEYKLSTFDLVLEQDKPVKTIKLNSGIVDVKITGSYNVNDVPNCFWKYLEKYFPAMTDEKKIPANARYTDNFNYKIKIKKFGIISGLFAPDLMISPGTILEGDFDAGRNELTMNGNSEKITYKTYEIKNWFIKASSLAQHIEISTGMERAWINDSLYLANVKLNTKSFDTKSDFELLWDNLSKRKNTGEITGDVSFSEKQVDLHFSKLEMFIADSLWRLNDSTDHVTFDTTGKVNLREMRFENNNQLVDFEGIVSKNPDDELNIEFRNFKLAQVNPLINSSQLKLYGVLTGKAKLIDALDKVIFASDFDFTNLYFNDIKLGNGEINCNYNSLQEMVSVNGFFSKGAATITNGKLINNIEFSGNYFPTKKEDNLDLTLKLKALDIALFQPYAKGMLTFSKGFVDGTAFVKGSTSKPLVTGRMNLLNIEKMRVDYLNTFYDIKKGVVEIFPERIQLGADSTGNTAIPDPLHLYDEKGHEATVWGNVFHNNFKVEKLDFDINVNDFMVLNTSGANNPSYFGKAFVTGNVGIYGNLDYMNMDINLKTEKGTQFNIPLSGPATVEENNFIIFVKVDSLNKNAEEYKNDLSGINMNFHLEATPDAEVQLIFDSKAGDVIKARGAGNITMNINTKGKFEMFGLYTLTDGNYLFSLENFISKKFDIESGSTIKWTGDPLNADINITASYRQRTSLTPFFPSDSTGTYSKRIPANVMLYMRDRLLEPDITFGIQLPTVDESTRQTVMNYINNDQELNRQVFSLLILKSFVSPLQLSSQGVSMGGGAAAAATSSEMLSNQISNWLSTLSTGVDIAVNYQPGSTMSNEQLDLALSKQLFNDRLSIDGNVGVNNSATQKTSNMIGDLIVDYKVYPDGKLRLKGFNKSNDNTQITTQGGPFTQGVGIFYREEFNTIDDLYKRYLGWLDRKKKKAAAGTENTESSP